MSTLSYVVLDLDHSPQANALVKRLDASKAFKRLAENDDLEAARQWAMQFVDWYNTEHRHSGIRFVTPAQRHQGHDIAVLEKRHVLYQQARHQNPGRWSQHTRNWTPVQRVALNPERECIAAKIAA